MNRIAAAARTIAAVLLSPLFLAPVSASAASAAAAEASPPRFTLHVSPPRVNEETIASIHNGMTKSEITALIGSPDRTVDFALSRTRAWDYDFVDAWGLYAEFSVIFNDAGLVVGKLHARRVAG